MINDLLYGCLGTIGYAMYVEFHPKIGNIWIRMDSDGNKSISIQSLLNLMKKSSIDPVFWKSENLDMNYAVFVGSTWTILKTFNYFIA
tara:strand:- start:87 stop:350 length:264 start_codon:yes stop_codon:yes gene_type:complete